MKCNSIAKTVIETTLTAIRASGTKHRLYYHLFIGGCDTIRVHSYCIVSFHPWLRIILVRSGNIGDAQNRGCVRSKGIQIIEVESFNTLVHSSSEIQRIYTLALNFSISPKNHYI